MTKIGLRRATVADASAILDIYAHYVLNTSITFEVDVPTEEEMQARIAEVTGDYPYLILEIDGKAVAFAYAHRYLARAAYRWNVQFSVYVDKEYCKHYHIGTALYTALKKIVSLQNVQNVYGLVADTNVKSFALHQKIGFKKLATYSKIGYKLGKWHDVAIFEMILGEHSVPVDDFISIADIDENIIEEILQECREMVNI